MTQRNTLLPLLINNAAACQLKTKKYDEVLTLCDKALRLEPDNPKALFRRATAHYERSEYDEAERDYGRLVSQANFDEKTAVVVKRRLGQIQKKRKDVTEQQKKKFSGMFGKTTLYDDIPSPTSSSSSSSSVTKSWFSLKWLWSNATEMCCRRKHKANPSKKKV